MLKYTYFKDCQELLRKFYQRIRVFNRGCILFVIKIAKWWDKYRMQHISNVLDALIEFKSEDDGTYELLTHQLIEYSSGYQVSFVRPEAFEQLSHDEWDLLTAYCCEHLNSEAHIGVYNGSAEVSFHSMERFKAEETMDQFNQESILDWDKKVVYPEEIIRWFIFNPNYDKNKTVNYHEILKRI